MAANTSSTSAPVSSQGTVNKLLAGGFHPIALVAIAPGEGDDGDESGGDGQDSKNNATVRGIDGLHGNCHQKWKCYADANHGDDKLEPEMAWRQRASKDDKQCERVETSDCRARRRESERVNRRDGNACGRQRTGEDGNADKAKQQAERLTGRRS